MAFTDKYLERLKNCIDPQTQTLSCSFFNRNLSFPNRIDLPERFDIALLINRLEAAERVCEIIRSASGHDAFPEVDQEWLFIYPALDEWVKEAGKE